MNQEEALLKIQEIFAKNFSIKPEEVMPTSKLYEELRLDSLDAVDLVLELQDLTGKKIKPEVFKGVRTVQDVIMIVVSLEEGTDPGQ
jgi:acyl carrier protein